jgi:hypothetical protein
MCTLKAINLEDLSALKEAELRKVPGRKNVDDIKSCMDRNVMRQKKTSIQIKVMFREI